MAKVQLDLKIDTSAATPQVAALVQSLESLAKASKNVQSQPSVTPPAPQVLSSWERISKLLVGDAEAAAKLKSNLGGAFSAIRSAAASGAEATGLAGPAAGLLSVMGSAGSIAAAGAALLGVVAVATGLAVKMALEFEKSAARAGASLSLGFGGSLQSNMQRVEAASYSGEKYGYNVQEMIAAMESYGRASGATTAQATAAAEAMATYGRSYGLDPSHVGAIVGSFQAASGDRGDFASNANDIFGGAEQAGPLGRRIDEFASTATSVLQSIEYNQAGSNIDPARATGFTAGIAREGGIYATGGGVAATLAAGEDLVGGGTSDIQKSALLMRAGISEKDIVLGNVGQDGGNIRKVLTEVQKEYGNLHGTLGSEALVSLLGQSEARMIEGLKDPIKDFGMPKTRADTEREAKQRADEFASTPEGMAAHAMAVLSNTMTADGEKLVQLGKKILDETDAAGKLTAAINMLDKDFTSFTHWWESLTKGDPNAPDLSKYDAPSNLTGDAAAAYTEAVNKGVKPSVAANWARAGASGEDAALLTAITLHETGSQEGSNVQNAQGALAFGNYQFTPDTAEDNMSAEWLAKYGHIVVGHTGTGANQKPILGKGFQAFIGSPNAQRQAAVHYEHTLAKQAWDLGYRDDDFVRAVMKGWNSGDVNLAHTYAATADNPSSADYEATGLALYKKLEAGGVDIEIKVTPKQKPAPYRAPQKPRAVPLATTKPNPSAGKPDMRDSVSGNW